MLFVYLHGFLSGPNAVKAGILKRFLAAYPKAHFEAPAYPDEPLQADAYLDAFIREHLDEPMILVGSSMGGFMATVLQARFKLPAVLINPCVHPQDYFLSLAQNQHNDYSGEDFTLTPAMLEQLKRMDAETVHFIPKLTAVFLQKGDEVLDYRKALNFYVGADITLEEYGCHAFSGFERICPKILEYAQHWISKS